MKPIKTISDEEFFSALLVISTKLLENKSVSCEVTDERFKNYEFDIDIKINRLVNLDTKQILIKNNKVVEK